MRSKTYWAGQYLLAASSMFALISLIDFLSGKSFTATWPATLGWSCAAAAIFVASRYRQARAGAACALCEDGKPAAKPRR